MASYYDLSSIGISGKECTLNHVRLRASSIIHGKFLNEGVLVSLASGSCRFRGLRLKVLQFNGWGLRI